jgi:hypothetical protein
MNHSGKIGAPISNSVGDDENKYGERDPLNLENEAEITTNILEDPEIVEGKPSAPQYFYFNY